VDRIVSSMNWYRIEVQIAEDILGGLYGVNPQRYDRITAKYGANAYRIAQGWVNKIWYKEYTLDDLKIAYNVANEIMCGVYGNGQERRQKIISKYGENVRMLAQAMVDDVITRAV